MIVNILLSIFLLLHCTIYYYGSKNNIKYSAVIFASSWAAMFYILLNDLNYMYIWTIYTAMVITYSYCARKKIKNNFKNIFIVSLGIFTICSNIIFFYMVNNQINQIESVRSTIKITLVKTYEKSTAKEKTIIAKIAQEYNESINKRPIKMYKTTLYKKISLYAISFWGTLISILLYRHSKRKKRD